MEIILSFEYILMTKPILKSKVYLFIFINLDYLHIF